MKTKILTLICIALTKFGFGQYEQYIQYVTPFLNDSIQSGFFYFTTPNNFQAGQLYQLYRQNAPDLNNNMVLTDQHADSLIGFAHYKYQQTYMNIPVEGAGCIEHYDTNGSLSYMNAKVADSIKKSHLPKISSDEAISGLIKALKKDTTLVFAWEDEDWEKQIQLDNDDEYATWYPTAELIWAIDTMKDVQLIIPGSRYTLAYKIPITIVEPEYETFYYFVDANTGNILKVNSTHRHDGPAAVTGYGTRTIDTRWKGGFTQGWILHANDATRDIHTKKNIGGSFSSWSSRPETKTSNDQWGNVYETETTVHYHVCNTWDYYRNVFGRTGQNNEGRLIRVHSQWGAINADFYPGGGSHNNLRFGKTNLSADYGKEPSVVAHEFTHGVIYHSTNLEYLYESGALNESFCDIMGISAHATMLDGGNTDWIYGNFVPNDIQKQRSLKLPKTMGEHIEGLNTLVLGQPDTYGGIYWYTGAYDFGGVHINSGVQNKWFYVLANGNSGYNDLSNYYDVEGIGIAKAARIAYYTMTSGLMISSQFSDSRQSTINFAKNLYGECSKEHKAVIDAWYAVGLGNPNTCPFLSVDEVEEQNILVYPNPTNGSLTIDIPRSVSNPILMYDVSGKLVKKIENKALLFSTDVGSLESGVYLINFDFDGKQMVKRIAVQK